ncbi:hypothetical protein [Nocardioides sp. zg-1228]|uniref:hypothetical protein n=1 Tax=Nocardioides sp. zg-1228 TaxID=2763008 RepID=UPI0016425F9B|nr:hypothetical protein [Nocardioides sp. zg-1228]MBC2931792.1 hypothetical protein [Nocardioides sp. zg-1228]QSF57369.1 hypothetical protein JX575_17770 [Nocardioides sp. zg-1228]
MSKMDNLRAMREAKYAEAQKRSSSAPARPRAAAPVAPPAAAARTPARSAAQPEVGADQPATEELCGHRNMSGRTCTREQGHPQKSHRYS